MKWQTAWQLLKDILLTGTGLAVIITQIRSPHPSDVLLVAGLALTVPSAATHAAAVLSGPGGAHPSSESSAPHGEPPSPPSSSPPPG